MRTFPDKESIRLELLNQLRTQLVDLKRAVATAKDATTHEEAKSEGKYDTRAIESGYMAGAQEVRLKELEGKVALCDALRLRSFEGDAPIGNGALVLLADEESGDERLYLILNHLGGSVVMSNGHNVRIIASNSSAGIALKGLYADEEYAFGSKLGLVKAVL